MAVYLSFTSLNPRAMPSRFPQGYFSLTMRLMKAGNDNLSPIASATMALRQDHKRTLDIGIEAMV